MKLLIGTLFFLYHVVQPGASSSSLDPGWSLAAGASLFSPNGMIELRVRKDLGELVLFHRKLCRPIWSAPWTQAWADAKLKLTPQGRPQLTGSREWGNYQVYWQADNFTTNATQETPTLYVRDSGRIEVVDTPNRLLSKSPSPDPTAQVVIWSTPDPHLRREDGVKEMSPHSCEYSINKFSLKKGDMLFTEREIFSENGDAHLRMEQNGDLAVYRRANGSSEKTKIWSANTTKKGHLATMDAFGTFAVVDNSWNPVWSSLEHGGKTGSNGVLRIDDDGTLRIQNSDGSFLWIWDSEHGRVKSQ